MTAMRLCGYAASADGLRDFVSTGGLYLLSDIPASQCTGHRDRDVYAAPPDGFEGVYESDHQSGVEPLCMVASPPGSSAQ